MVPIDCTRVEPNKTRATICPNPHVFSESPNRRCSLEYRKENIMYVCNGNCNKESSSTLDLRFVWPNIPDSDMAFINFLASDHWKGL